MRPFDPRLRSHLRPARVPLTGVVVAGVVGGALVLGQAFALADLVVGLLAAPNEDHWHRAAWWLIGITLARAAVDAGGALAADRAANVVTTRLRSRVLRAALDLDAGALSARRSGELALLGTRGVAAVEPYITRYLPTLVVATVLPPLALIVIGVLDPWAGLIVLCTLPLVPVFAILIGVTTRDRAEHQYRTLSALAGHFLDVVRGLPTLVTFNRAGYQSGRIRQVTDRYRRATLDTLRLAFASSVALELIATLSVALVAVSVGLRLASGGLDFESALVLLLLAPEAYWPLRRVGTEFHAAAEGVATFAAIDELLTSSPMSEHLAPITDRVDPVPLHLSDLVVHYPGADSPALVLDACTIPATGITAIVGPSGAGKSTLVQTLRGELTPSTGSVTLAGEPLQPDAWRRLVAQVPQTPWLTAGTIAENLRLGRQDSTDAELREVLHSVALDHDLDTPLGEDGAGLSAGQRARLALARVVLADRPYVVLDEPTAHLDAETEAVLLATLTRLAEHSTVIVVAHSPALVRAAENVITLTTPAALVTPSPTVSPTARPSSPVDDVVPEHQTTGRLVLGTVLGTLASLSGVALTATAGWLIARSAEHPPVLMLMVAIIGVRTFGLARPVLRYAERLVSHDVALRLLAETRARVYDVLVPLSPGRLGRRRGDLLSSVVDDVDAELDDLLRVRQPIQIWLGVSVVAVVFVAFLSPVAAVPVVSLSFGGGALVLFIAWWGTRRGEAGFVAGRAALSDEIVGSLQSARQLVAWQADDAAVARLDVLGRELAADRQTSAHALALARAVLTVLAGAAVLATGWLVAPSVADGSVSGPLAALLLLTPLALAEVLGTLPEAGAMAVRTSASRQRLAALAMLDPAATEPIAPSDLDSTSPFELRDLSIGWTDRPVLSGLDATVPAGTAIGVVGPSGCGKSTLAAVLVRHLDPLAGRYLLGGTDTSSVTSIDVRRHVGLIDDDPYVFASSVRENLRLARPSASDDELIDALLGADLGDWFARHPAGLDTLLGDGAAAVSGGERARIGIARALLADPEILVLDEPTAHLDSQTARSVTRTVLGTRAGRTLIWITHDRIGLEAMDEVWDLQAAATARGRFPRSPGSRSPAPR